MCIYVCTLAGRGSVVERTGSIIVCFCSWSAFLLLLFPCFTCLLVLCSTSGASQLSVRTAGSNPCSSERWTPEKTLTLICSPRRKTTTCTKYSVCVICDLLRPAWLHVFNSFNLSDLLFCFIAVHNVKPECLDDYNELW